MSCLLIYQVKHRKQGGPGQEARAREIAGERGGRRNARRKETRWWARRTHRWRSGGSEPSAVRCNASPTHPPLSSYARRYNAQCENQNPARVNGEPEVEVNVAEVVCSNHLSMRL